MLYSSHQALRAGQKLTANMVSAGLTMQMLMWGALAPRQLSATRDLCDRVARDYPKPAWKIPQTSIAGKIVGVSEEVVQDKAFGQLLHFKRDTDRQDPRLLIVAPMSGHHATLLRETVEQLLPNHDVYITDWKDAREVPLSQGDFGLDDYIDYVKDFLKTVGPGAHVLAVCQPTVPTLAAVSELEAEGAAHQPRSMTLMAGPLDTRAAATEVTRLAERRPISWFESNVIGKVPDGYPGAGRLVYPGFVQLTSFMAMKPGKHVKSHLDMLNALVAQDQDRADKIKGFYDEYLAVCDLPARFYLETVQQVFQEHSLAEGRLEHRGKRVDPSCIKRTALLTVEGDKDDISAPGQTLAAHQMCSGLAPEHRYHYLQPGAGHYGIFAGRSWREEIAPRVTGFIRAIDTQGYAPATESKLPERY
ncbi:polyhydroxyalkanoate depolymerase [bacterium CPR1]|nr:polyhydroxyalkanoate depolymerase [bacterium CPR1]